MMVPEYLAAPHCTNATRVLILGECSLAVALANAFESLGAFVTMVGESAQVDNVEVLRDVVERFHPDFVVPASDEVSIATLQQLHAQVAVDIVPSSSFLERSYDRERIYHIASDELGLPTPRFGCASSADEAVEVAQTLRFPCVARAVENTGEGSSYMVHNAEDATHAWEKLQASRIIIERIVQYDYAMTIVAVRSIDPDTGKLATWFCQPIGKVMEHGRLVGAFQPLLLEQVALDSAHSVVARITNAIGGRGVFSVDLFVSGEDVYFSGLSVHPNDVAAVMAVTQRLSQATLVARAVLGLPVDVTLTSPGAFRVLELADARIPRATVAAALAVPEAHVRFTRGGYCLVSATADDATQAYERASFAYDRLTTPEAPDGDAAAVTPEPVDGTTEAAEEDTAPESAAVAAAGTENPDGGSPER